MMQGFVLGAKVFPWFQASEASGGESSDYDCCTKRKRLIVKMGSYSRLVDPSAPAHDTAHMCKRRTSAHADCLHQDRAPSLQTQARTLNLGTQCWRKTCQRILIWELPKLRRHYATPHRRQLLIRTPKKGHPTYGSSRINMVESASSAASTLDVSHRRFLRHPRIALEVAS